MSINNELHRNINKGSQFDKYFENVSCNATFEKKGDTTQVLHLMRKHAEKYAYQTKKIAPLLKGSTIEQTVDNIYNFLYKHVQYNIDGYEQNLRSPACSWKQRIEGIDCKSYAIFASGILQNLGIEHYFRKVKQTHYQPNYWTHVYVVVKSNGNQLVIDPTIHSNNEVEYVQKKDIKVSKLPIYSLNAGAQGVPTLTQDNEILNVFFEVVAFLRKIGVKEPIIQIVNQKVQQAYYKHGKFDFPFRLLPNNHLLIDNEHIPLYPTSLNAGREVVRAVGTTVAGIDTSIFKISTPSNTSLQSGGGSGGGIASSLGLLLADPTGISSILSILGNFDIAANVSNVLKYGFSSWGAASDPAKMKTDIETKYMPLVNQKFAQLKQSTNAASLGINLTELDKVISFFASYGTASVNRRSWAGSTTASFKLLSKTFTDFYSQTMLPIIDEFKNNGYKIQQNTTTANFGDFDQIYKIDPNDANTTAEKNGNFSYKKYTITGMPKAPNSFQQQYVNGQASPNNSISNTNLSKIIGFGSAAALALFFVVPKMTYKKEKK